VIEVDVSQMHVKDILYVNQLVLPEGVTDLGEPDRTLSPSLPQVNAEAEAEAGTDRYTDRIGRESNGSLSLNWLRLLALIRPGSTTRPWFYYLINCPALQSVEERHVRGFPTPNSADVAA